LELLPLALALLLHRPVFCALYFPPAIPLSPLFLWSLRQPLLCYGRARHFPAGTMENPSALRFLNDRLTAFGVIDLASDLFPPISPFPSQPDSFIL